MSRNDKVLGVATSGRLEWRSRVREEVWDRSPTFALRSPWILADPGWQGWRECL